MAEVSLSPLRGVASGLGAAAAGGVLGGAALVGTRALFPVLLLIQLVVALAWVAYVDAPAPVPALAIMAGSALVADVLAVRDLGRGASATVGVVAGAFILAVLATLADRRRTRVAESLAITGTGVLLVVFAAQLLSVEQTRTGGDVVAVAMLAVGTALAVARLADVVIGGPPAVPESGRGLLGIVVGVGVAVVFGALLGAANSPLSGASGVVLCIAAAGTALVADLAVELGTHAAVDARSLSAARPLTALVPLFAAAPVVYSLDRLLVA